MGMISTCYLVPHPPIIIPEIGQGDEKRANKTIEAMEEISRDVASQKPEVIIVITPHGPLFRDAMAVGIRRKFSGDFGNFGQPEVSLSLPGHTGMAFAIMEEAAAESIPVIAVDDDTCEKYGISPVLDHGTSVPMYFINKRYQGFKIIPINYGLLTRQELFTFGKCIRRAVEKGKGRTVLVCSGDLSHRLSEGAPGGFSKRGIEFDESLVSHLKNMEVDKIMEMDPQLVEEAGECGFRSVMIMLGVLDGFEAKSRILSYEGPYGVGYCTGVFRPQRAVSQVGQREIVVQKAKDDACETGKDSYVGLARLALETYVREGKVPHAPNGLPQEMLDKKAGAFVSLKVAGRLRGCIGTISPTTDNIAQEIIQNAISAGARDPRFYPVGREELDQLVYSVDVLGQPEVIKSVDQLDVKKYGVIVRWGGRSGLLLPDLEGVDTPQHQVAIALQKAGIDPAEKYILERFEVIRHS